MPIFSVLINQQLERLGRITVEADDEASAMEEVQAMIDDDDFESEVLWGEENVDTTDVVSCDAEESEEEE